MSDDLRDLNFAYEALVQARPGYKLAEDFYNGIVKEVYSSPQVAALLEKFGLSDLPPFNLSHIPVDVVADKLRISQVTSDEVGVDPLLDELSKSNELKEELPSLLRDACKYGDAYMMVWPQTDEDEAITGVTMRAQSPLTTRVFYSAKDPLIKAFAIQSWQEGPKGAAVIRADLHYADRIVRYSQPVKTTAGSKAAKWTPFTADGQPAELTNPFGEVPFFHYRTGRTYGIPEHINAYGPQSAINKLITSHLATVDFQSFPQRYALLDPKADQSGSERGPLDDDDTEDGPGAGSASQSQLAASPAAVWQLRGMSSVGEFSAADASNFLEPIDRYTKLMAQATGVPMHAFDSTGDAISGTSRREADEPLYARVEALQEMFGATHERAMEFALSVLDVEAEVSVHWAPIRKPRDLSLEDWAVIEKKHQLGFSMEYLLTEAGYTLAQIKKLMRTNQVGADAPTITESADAETEGDTA
ncbi:hypothetical protein ACFUN8_18520 [Streptomyces sp. NPDC057307]|uniref:hypothetical protein n=1 Tax=Streptomyces sp. NPDC057307 TaxID=3346096 RepID=UPI0036453A78